ncbi:MAG: amino acid permease [Gemmatimonadales bacterium]
MKGRPGEPAGLARGLGSVEATTLVVGGIIGSGIFLGPSIVAREVGAPGLSLLVWLAAGLLATCGALCYAELGAAIPETGGTYAFLRRAYRSRLLGFLFGWGFFFVDGPGAIAAVATAFATYSGFFLGRLLPYGDWGVRVVAIGSIAVLTLLQCAGVRAGGIAQNLLTALKLVTLAAIIVIPLALGTGSLDRLAPILPPERSGIWLAFGAAMIPTLFAYAGWTFSTYVAGEIRDPARNLPRSIIGGIGIVLVVYLGVNVAYLVALPFDRLAASTLVATDAVEATVGPWGGALVAAAVMAATFGALNAGILAYPRIGFALARDGLFFPTVARVGARSHAPVRAILLQGTIACLFAASGSYEGILGYFAFVDYAFFFLAVAGVLVLRRTEPDLPRPYRVWGYPLTPLLFLAISAAYLVTVLHRRPIESLVGLGLTLTGLPFYRYWAGRSRVSGPAGS